MLAMGTMPNPDALTLKLWKRASANFCQPDKLSSTLSPMFSTRKPNISTALFVISFKQIRAVLDFGCYYSHKGDEYEEEIPGLMTRKEVQETPDTWGRQSK